MFFPRSSIVDKVNDIIFDGQDNDIVFIVANKGIGKLKLLYEISDIESINDDVIIADGQRIRRTCSCLTKCYIDGICSYIEKQNTIDRLISFIDFLPNPPRSDLLTDQGIIDIATITSLLFKMPLCDLKDIYVQLAGETPLIIFASAIFLDPVDMDYLLNLKNDTWGAKITFFIALRPTPDCINTIESICKKNENRVWIFPLMPHITKESHNKYPTSIATISIDNIGNSNNIDFAEAILSSNAYFDTYNLVEQILSFDFQPSHLFLLANQEIRVCDQQYLKTIVRKIYQTELPEYDKRLILPHEGKLLWLDALSYYLTLYDGMQKALLATQSFFFDVIANADQFIYGKPERKACSSLLTEAARHKPNQLAEGYSSYFANFAALSKALSIQKRGAHVTTEISDFALNILDKVVIDLTDSCMTAFPIIHEKTQICSILDIGIETIIQSLNNMEPSAKLKASTKEGISSYQETCLSIAYKWSDTTLIDGVVSLQKALYQLGLTIPFVFTDLKNAEKKYLLEYLELRLLSENLQISNIVSSSYTPTTHNMNSNDIFSEHALCENIEKALITIQQNKTYDGLSEDPLNDILRDLLRMKYDHIRDQTRHGTSGSGDGIGRVDILLCDNSDYPHAVIEPLRLSSLDKKVFSNHINKSIKNYNPTGCPFVFTVIYSFSKNFNEFWNKVYNFLNDYNFPFTESKSVCSIDILRTETRHAKIILYRSGKPLSLHVYAINLYKT